ncbi:aspartate/glutamate racemase family protein [Mariniflexile sp. AS56]|uniref:aspartate/glutamate racemase family protein n=1 Tax=Mariniflexile sp. AS56 TaxID=3063957 RepID=UPI0026EAF809|nr:amino acid racemase [Mariniflexile sp. AS56]MDO7173719.1 amino acid racemase [Mariniflexile sp. AS56]
MKKIGLVGGISWTSTLDYYKHINQGVNQRLGGLNSAECSLYSLNFSDIEKKGWENCFELVLDACKKLILTDVDAIALCANTAHIFADKLQEEINIPILSIVKVTADAINRQNLKKVGLLGTKLTMEMDFYRDKMSTDNIEIIIPESIEDLVKIDQIIMTELGKGVIKNQSKERLINCIQNLINIGAEAIILGCTELPLIIKQSDITIPVFDTTKIHVNNIIEFIINENNALK